ncbi:TPA: hypothetical protein ACNOIH_002844, partial [Klebsiella aerogenes]
GFGPAIDGAPRYFVGWRYAYPTYGPCHGELKVSTVVPVVTETAGVSGLKIAETFPARPEACRDKSKEPRSGDFGGQSPGGTGGGGDWPPLCAPCTTANRLQEN